MDNAFQKTLKAWVATFTLFTLGACSYVDEVDSPQLSPTQADEDKIVLRIPSIDIQTTSNVNSIDLFQFSDGAFVKKLTVDASKDNIVEFERKPGTRIYNLAGYTVESTHKLTEQDELNH